MDATQHAIEVLGAPAIPGLVFRHFGGPADFPAMVAALNASEAADGEERVVTVEGITNNYAHLSNSDPAHDILIIEVNGEVAGYARVFWFDETGGPIVYTPFAYLAPAWRRKGIGRAVLHWMEGRLAEIAADHPTDRPKVYQTFALQGAVGLTALLEQEGYRPVRYFYQMVRPDLEAIPDFPLPAGIEVRPALPEHYRGIWDAGNEAFRDHWGYSPPTEEDYLAWLNDKEHFQPDLWQIAWDVATDQVAGQVGTYIDYAENEEFHRQRGWTEGISVRRPWRRRGLARALIVRSLRAQKAAGMTESALGVDSENISGATRVYEACGFRVMKRNTAYRKPLAGGPA